MNENVVYWIIGLALFCGSLRAWHEYSRKREGNYSGASVFSGILFRNACASLPFLVVGYLVAHLVIKYW
jgi:hypothetical protein